MALDGLQKMLKDEFKNQKVNLCRYADDIVITAKTKEIAEQVKELVTEFLKERGLELSEEKTHIIHIREGYDFLGWNIRKYNGKMITKPSAKSVKAIDEKLHEAILDKGQALTQKQLIQKLNPILRGWSNYHKSTCAKKTFAKVARNLYIKLWRWAQRRHHNKGRLFTISCEVR